MRVLITGASGCVGRAIGAAARAGGHEVAGMARHAAEGVDFVGAVEDADAVAAAARGRDVVVHLAGWVHRVPSGDADLAELRASILEGTRHAARAARAAGSRLIVASTVAVYGSLLPGPCDEQTPPSPDSPYARAKLEAEAVAREIDPKALILRPALVYGPWDRGNMMTLIDGVMRGRVFVVGKGDNRKSVIYAENLADRVVLALGRSDLGGVWIAADEAPTQAELIAAIARALGRRPPRRLPKPLVLAGATLLDAGGGPWRERVRKLASSTEFRGTALDGRLDYRPRVGLEEGLLRTIGWYRARRWT